MGARENRGLKPWPMGGREGYCRQERVGGGSFERAARGRNRRKITQQQLIFYNRKRAIRRKP